MPWNGQAVSFQCDSSCFVRKFFIVAFLLITWRRTVLVSYIEVISFVPITQIGLAVATTNRWIRFIAVTCPFGD